MSIAKFSLDKNWNKWMSYWRSQTRICNSISTSVANSQYQLRTSNILVNHQKQRCCSPKVIIKQQLKKKKKDYHKILQHDWNYWRARGSWKTNATSWPTAVMIPLNKTWRRCFFMISLPPSSPFFCLRHKKVFNNSLQYYNIQ